LFKPFVFGTCLPVRDIICWKNCYHY